MYQNHIKETNNNCNEGLLSDHKEKLFDAIKRIKHEVDECREAERETYIESRQVENSFESLEREISAEFQNLHSFLDEEESKEMDRLRRERQKQLKQLKERKKKMAEQGRDLERAISVLNSKLTEENSPKLIRGEQKCERGQEGEEEEKEEKEEENSLDSFHKTSRKRLCTTAEPHVGYPESLPPLFPSGPSRSKVRFVPPAEVDTEVRSGQFVGPIQYRIWKHMKSCLYPNITPMTIDPDTAHPNLSVSQSCTSVCFEEDKDTKHVQANPQRFHYYYCALGHQSFTTGRHYWEVDVGQKTAWRLGVAREDVPRGEMDATGESSGLWTLALMGGSVQAYTDPKPTKVNVSLRLVRIGVFLDCEKEEVSFYNAVTMAPIYTFTMGTVGVPLFPFYNPCDADDGKNTESLKIFNPSL